MPTRLLLEGPDITALLARVRAEHGEDATIVKAEKVRSGGVGGFFAKQRYEVIVEVDDRPAAVAPPEPPVAAAPAAPVSPVDELLAEIHAKSEMATKSAPTNFAHLSRYLDLAGSDGTAGLAALTDHADTADVVEVSAPKVPSTPTAFAPPATAWPSAWSASPQERTPAEPVVAEPVVAELAIEPAHSLSTESGDFAAVLAQLTHDLQDAEAAITGEEPDYTPDPRIAEILAAALASEPEVDSEPEPEAVTFRPLYSVPSLATAPAPVSAPLRASSPAGQAALAHVITVDPEVHADALTVSTPVAVSGPVAVRSVAETVSTYDRVRATGLPAAMADGLDLDKGDLYGELLHAFGELPLAPALPRRAGDVLVVVGELASALPVARQLAKKMRIDGGALLLAAASTNGTGIPAAQRVTGPADALRRSRRMHRADTPHVVVVDVAFDCDSAEWARDIADSFGATGVWAVVDATRKTEDVADHLSALGPVDALVVAHASSTRDPATVLELGVPVAMVDGRTSSPRAWAELICERLDHGQPR